jgi:hypothetical protein
VIFGFSGINFFATFLPLMLVERMGRRRLLLISVFGVFIAMTMLGGGFLLINRDTAKVVKDYGNSSRCFDYS